MKLVTDERKSHASRTVEGRTVLGLAQDEVHEAKRLPEEDASSPEQGDRNSIPSGTSVPDQETVGGELRTSQ